MSRGLTPSDRSAIRTQICSTTQAGPKREVLLYKYLCGPEAFPRRRDFMESFLRIPEKKTAGQRRIPFIFNKAQRLVEAVRTKYERAGKPFRGATLKARQFGLSTYWLAAMMEEVTRNHNVRACLLADDEALAQTLLETGKVMRDHLPFQLPTKYENRAKLHFDVPINSFIDLATAKSDNPCRGRTYRFLHATEPGTWDKPEKKVASVNQAVPTQPGTVLSYEGTANGTGNWWHDFWWDAHNNNNDYHAFFFPWFYDWKFDYWLEPEEGDGEKIMTTLDDEEKYLVNHFGVNLGQLKWPQPHPQQLLRRPGPLPPRVPGHPGGGIPGIGTPRLQRQVHHQAARQDPRAPVARRHPDRRLLRGRLQVHLPGQPPRPAHHLAPAHQQWHLRGG